MNSPSGEATPAVADRRLAIRQATDAAHRRVEGIVESAGFFRSRPAYLDYLAATYRVRGALERQLEASDIETVLPDWPSRRLAGAIAADISDLGGQAATPEKSPPVRFSPQELLGVAYVLEGSTLGARVLVRMATDLGLGPAFGARHLNQQATATRAWTTFLAALEGAAVAPCHIAANRTFDAFAEAYVGIGPGAARTAS